MQAPIMWSVNIDVGVQKMFFHLGFCILPAWWWQCWLPSTTVSLPSGHKGWIAGGCYIPLALPPSQSNLALRLHNAEGELLTDISSFPPLECLEPLHPPSLQVAVYSCAHTSRDIKTENFRSELKYLIDKPKNCSGSDLVSHTPINRELKKCLYEAQT